MQILRTSCLAVKHRNWCLGPGRALSRVESPWQAAEYLGRIVSGRFVQIFVQLSGGYVDSTGAIVRFVRREALDSSLWIAGWYLLDFLQLGSRRLMCLARSIGKSSKRNILS